MKPWTYGIEGTAAADLWRDRCMDWIAACEACWVYERAMEALLALTAELE